MLKVFFSPVFLWFIAGVILILAEFMIPGFVICFFGIAALIVAGLVWLIPALSVTGQLLIFAALGVVLLLLCRLLLPRAFRGKKDDDELDIDSDNIAGSSCVCTEAISPQAAGKVEFRGSTWLAVADSLIAPGENCTVLSRNNLTLKVVKKEQ
ncbi:MAG: NfeD family protein [Lentisphaerae bacterium]|nr:NfeD family protein [Lentisphaerota bacterium]